MDIIYIYIYSWNAMASKFAGWISSDKADVQEQIYIQD